MKIAVSGKGGVGKSTVSASLALMLAEAGRRVLAVDADPDANMADSLGIPAPEQEKILPIARQAALIEERTGAKAGSFGQMFSLSPEVSDIADRFAYRWRGVDFISMGEAKRGGGGCMCPENSLIRALVSNLVLERGEDVIMDMEAGIEHLGRGTARGVDLMLIVCEPGQRSINCGFQIVRLCRDIGLERISFIGNKVRGKEDEAFLTEKLSGQNVPGFLRWRDEIRTADRNGVSVRDHLGAENERVLKTLTENIIKEVGKC